MSTKKHDPKIEREMDAISMETEEAEQAARKAVRLRIVPCSLVDANAFIKLHHRHHTPHPFGHFAIACADASSVRGVAVVGRPSARMLCDGFTAEVTRLATDGAPNACSMLYGAAWRACRALGWLRLVTYTLPEEGGASLRAAGWRCIGEAGGGSWSTPSRPRTDKHPLQVKLRWEAN